MSRLEDWVGKAVRDGSVNPFEGTDAEERSLERVREAGVSWAASSRGRESTGAKGRTG